MPFVGRIWTKAAPRNPSLIGKEEVDHLRNWLVRYIEHAFRGVSLGTGSTIYEAAYLADYGFRPAELDRVRSAERIDWRRVPSGDLFSRPDAILFLDSAGKRFYSPAILCAVLKEGTNDGLMYDAFMYDLARSLQSSAEDDIPFGELYNASQRAAFVRFCKFAAYNAPRELGRDDPLRILSFIRELDPPVKRRRSRR